MALTPNFSSTESESSPNLVTFFDTSSGSDGTLTERRIFIQSANSTYIVPSGTTNDYIVWPIANASIQLDLLSQSTSANVTVIWYAGATPTYTKKILMIWDFFDYIFMFGLLQTQTSQPSIVNDTNYFGNFMQMIVNVFNAESAVTNMDDLYSSQGALNRNKNLINNQNLYF